MQKLAIISSVQPDIFSGIAKEKSFWFTPEEQKAALKGEKQVFADAIGIPDLEKKIQIEVIHAMDGIPANYSADAYILGGSPAMVTERDQKEWINKLIKFVEWEVSKWKPILGICFWHQILATALGGKVEPMSERKIGKWTFETNGEIFEGLWSHKQAVTDAGSGKIIGTWLGGMGSNSAIQMIQHDNATGMQLHPEFSPEFTAFLVKLMRWQIESEWLNATEILEQIKTLQSNPSRALLEGFVRKYYNI